MKLFALLLVLVGCGTSPEAPRCELGRVQSCPCVGGGQGAQECGPSGTAWSACVCSSRDAAVGDAVADGGADAAADASTGDVVAVGDAVLVDGAVAPRLYRSCDLGADCGAGLSCVAVPGLVRDAGAGRAVCTTSCATSADCASGALCVMGACQVECPTGEDRECAAWGTTCQVSTARVIGSRAPGAQYTAYCAP